MTVADACGLLATMPQDALFCIARGDSIGSYDPAESITLVPVAAQGTAYSDEDDNAVPVVAVA